MFRADSVTRRCSDGETERLEMALSANIPTKKKASAPADLPFDISLWFEINSCSYMTTRFSPFSTGSAGKIAMTVQLSGQVILTRE